MSKHSPISPDPKGPGRPKGPRGPSLVERAANVYDFTAGLRGSGVTTGAPIVQPTIPAPTAFHMNWESASPLGRFGQVATTADGTSVEVVAPTNPTERVAFVAKLENMAVEAGEEVPRVVFNSRTGTVVISDGLRVKSAAVTHGSLKVVISESSAVSQPGPFSRGQTQVTPQSKVSVDQGSGQMFHWPPGARLQTIIDTVNSLGASPDDIMAILQALDQAGAIEGELVVI